MPHPRKAPATVEEMFKEPHPGHHTICQTLRDIHEAVPDESTKEMVRLAFSMAKAMNDKLHYYKNKYEPERKHV